MDFKRVEKIFILAFILLNIFLFISYLNRQDIQYISSESASVDILKEIRESDIELPNLSVDPSQKEDVYSMQANTHNLLEEEMDRLSDDQTGTVNEEGTFYKSLLSSPIKLDGNPKKGFSEKDLTTIKNFINSDRVLFGKEYRYSHFDLLTSRFVFYQIVNNIPVADGTSEISLHVDPDGEIFSYEQTYAGPMTEQGNPLTLISNQRAIEILFSNNELPEKSKIHAPKLTYRRNLHLEDLSMYSPVWLVQVETDSELLSLCVDAVRGTIIKEAAATKMEEKSDQSSADNK